MYYALLIGFTKTEVDKMSFDELKYDNILKEYPGGEHLRVLEYNHITKVIFNNNLNEETIRWKITDIIYRSKDHETVFWIKDIIYPICNWTDLIIGRYKLSADYLKQVDPSRPGLDQHEFLYRLRPDLFQPC